MRAVNSWAGLCLSALICTAVPMSVGVALGADPDRAPASRDDGWRTAKPSEAGFDPAELARLTQDIAAGSIPNVHAVLVEQDGRLVYEAYFKGRDESWGQSLGIVEHGPTTRHDLRSVTKSVASLLLGMALGPAFEAELDRPITAFFPDREDDFGAGLETVKLRHVLTMTAGLEWNEMDVPYTSRDNDELRLYFTGDPTGLILKRPVVGTPGARWYYNGGLTHLLAGIIQRRSGLGLNDFVEQKLFGPLGIEDYEWMRSRIWPSSEPPSAASGLRMRARDLAKIGSLVLQDGVWAGRRLVPAGWIDASLTRYVETIPWDPSGTFGYGFMWYPGRTAGPDGFRVVRAAGNGDQRIILVPDQKIAVTVFAGNYNNFRHAAGDVVAKRVMAARRGN